MVKRNVCARACRFVPAQMTRSSNVDRLAPECVCPVLVDENVTEDLSSDARKRGFPLPGVEMAKLHFFHARRSVAARRHLAQQVPFARREFVKERGCGVIAAMRILPVRQCSTWPPAFVFECQYLEGFDMLQRRRIVDSKRRNGLAGRGFADFGDVGPHKQARPNLSTFPRDEISLEGKCQFGIRNGHGHVGL